MDSYIPHILLLSLFLLMQYAKRKQTQMTKVVVYTSHTHQNDSDIQIRIHSTPKLIPHIPYTPIQLPNLVLGMVASPDDTKKTQ
jgi:hypothetical protein